MKYKRIILLILIILWCGLIFNLSSQKAVNSTELSGGVINKVLNLFGHDITEYESSVVLCMQIVIRKSAHMFLYCILAILIKLELMEYNIKNSNVMAILLTILYAITDEIHQNFVMGRSCEVRDIIVDLVGALIGIGLICLYKYSKNKCRGD
ncbi:MAG: VanZ family protein [Clostridia bacterium]|nr:VanZ family protein [Clostridia bacterium]